MHIVNIHQTEYTIVLIIKNTINKFLMKTELSDLEWYIKIQNKTNIRYTENKKYPGAELRNEFVTD